MAPSTIFQLADLLRDHYLVVISTIPLTVNKTPNASFQVKSSPPTTRPMSIPKSGAVKAMGMT